MSCCCFFQSPSCVVNTEKSHEEDDDGERDATDIRWSSLQDKLQGANPREVVMETKSWILTVWKISEEDERVKKNTCIRK